MRCYAWVENLCGPLWQGLLRQGQVMAPVTAADGVCRLQPVTEIAALERAALPRLGLKKLVLPASDLLWTLEAGRYQPPPPAPPLAVVGVAACDLYALAYLDLAFADDALYQQRRSRLLLVGAACTASPGCHCPPWPAPPPFDLFIGAGRLWVGSSQGGAWLDALALDLGARGDEVFPEHLWQGQEPPLPQDLAQRFAASAGSPLWSQAAEPCLSCGACSALCPSCSCFELVDTMTAAGQVTRHRQWDNCFFHQHALVAGGHNFRPDRASRLRFRFEHKYLGFGTLRGVSSCVGCGRCAQLCPVGIDLARVLETLVDGEVAG